MRYGNCIIKEYPNFTNVSVFNFNIIDDTKIRCKPIERDKNTLSDNDKNKLHEEVLRISQMRARNKIFDIALLNQFQYFCTFTFNDKIVDALDYELAISKVKKWCQNAVQRQGLKYLLVPELHPSSGRIHLHGLLFFDNSITLSETGHFDSSGRKIYNLPLWRFGFSTIVRLDNGTSDRVAKYITKYITKDLDKITGNYYYAGGKGLVREPEKFYAFVNYDDFSGYEIIIDGGMSVKYSLMSKEDTLKLQFERIDNTNYDIPF